MIVLMAGLPASGKSTLCRELALRVNGAVLDKDGVRSALFSPTDIEYSTEQDDFCMQVVLQAAAYILRKDRSRVVFLDGRPFSRSYQIDEVLKVAAALTQDWRILECVCAEETARRRLAEQAALQEHSAGNRDYELYRQVRSAFQEIKLSKTIVDTDQPLDICIRHALEALC